MRKIKNFKINLRLKSISQVVKRAVDIVNISDDFEQIFHRSCRFYNKFLFPSVVYDTFSKEFCPFIYEKGTPQKWVAETIFFVTIGNVLEEKYRVNENAFGIYTDKIVCAIALDALEQSKNFVRRLISSEAHNENCEITKIINLEDKYYKEICDIISAEKICINIESGIVCPKYSSAGLFYWIPSRKKHK